MEGWSRLLLFLLLVNFSSMTAGGLLGRYWHKERCHAVQCLFGLICQGNCFKPPIAAVNMHSKERFYVIWWIHYRSCKIKAFCSVHTNTRQSVCVGKAATTVYWMRWTKGIMEETRHSDYYLEVKGSSGNVRGALTVYACWELAHKTSGGKAYIIVESKLKI